MGFATTNYTANPYGVTGQFVQDSPTGNPAIDNNPYLTGLRSHYQVGVDPNVAAAFNYQDPNAAAYTNNAQGQQALASQAAAQQLGVNNDQNALVAALQKQAAGQGPSIAQQQLGQAMDQSNRQAQSIQASAVANGVNPALAAQLAQNASANNAQSAAAQAAQGRIQEQFNGQSALAQVLAQQSGQNLNQQQLGNQSALNYYGMGQQGAQFGNTAQQNEQQMLSNNSNNAQAINAQVAMNNTKNKTGVFSTLAGGALGALGQGGAALLSDESTKEDVSRNTGRDLDAFIEALDAASWRYKEGVGEDSSRRRYGVMAQSLAKTAVGRSMLDKGEDGFWRIDTTRGFGAVLAAQKHLAEKLEALEKIRKAK